ncbi:MAG TPA: hypothetical protein VFD58_06675 [Blastocatellia bacterium]|nr:hypothetical protein [Blastocatellia bacterium]
MPVCITAQSPALLKVFSEYFSYYHPHLTGDNSPYSLVEPDGEPVTLDLQTEQALPPPEELLPPDAELLSRVGIVRLWRTPGRDHQAERFYFHTPATCFIVTSAASRAEGIITPQALQTPHLLANTWALSALLLLLRSRRIYHLHAAAAISPDGKLFLFCGEQRAGKTTLATALGIAGWNPVSDDSLLIHSAPPGARLSALRKAFHLSNEILSAWPQLAGVERQERDPDRSTVAGLELFGTAALAESSFTAIDRIILPHVTGEAASRLEKISPGEAILRLAEQSMLFQLWTEHTKRQMSLLTRLAGGAPCYRLLAGTDILADPHRAAEALSAAR